MDLNDLPASELARIDAICLEFEQDLRRGLQPDIDDIVSQRGGKYPELLRNEMQAVIAELSGARPPKSTEISNAVAPPLQVEIPAQAVASPAAANSGSQAELPGRVQQLPGFGDALGPYRIEGELGRGGMGVVYRATDTRLGRDVAIKVLAVAGRYQAELTDRFNREAKAVARISHPNVVELFDIGLVDGLPYAVMELLDGQTLLDRLAHGAMPPADVRLLGAQIADALESSHNHGVIHRDLKPHNVMLIGRAPRGPDLSTQSPAAGASSNAYDEASTPLDATIAADPSLAVRSLAATVSGATTGATMPPSASTVDGVPVSELIVKLFDFGLSRAPRSMAADLTDRDSVASDSDRPSTVDDADDATREGMILGTPGYMSPEQARGEITGPAADLFGLGCIMFEAFYGRRAFDGRTPADRFAATLKQSPPADPVRRRADPVLAELIDQCLAKDIDQRPASASEVLQRLQASATNGVAPTALTRGRGSTVGQPVSPAGGGVLLSRRRLMELVAGGVAGTMAGMAGGTWSNLGDVNSLAVLTLIDEQAQRDSDGESDRAWGTRPPSLGEEISGLLVNELSRLENVTVPKFFPLRAKTPKQYVEIAETLDVDYLVDGSFRLVTAADGNLEYRISLQVISGKDGKQEWGEDIQVPGGTNLIQQREVAKRLATVINRGFASPGLSTEPPAVNAFRCLNKGQTISDPDSTESMQMALDCFKNALSEAGNFADAMAAIALTSITLAARTDPATAQTLIGEAREFTDPKLKDVNELVDARLASTMIAWQLDRNYRQPLDELQRLAQLTANRWQIHHQWGLLLLTMGRDYEAIERLEQAARLHPMSKMLKMEIARAFWYRGAIDQAETIARVAITTDLTDAFARGFLIDLHEQQLDYPAAASIDPELGDVAVGARDQYFEKRSTRLETLPYGPFGQAANLAILQQRSEASGLDASSRLLIWKNTQSPALPLLLARHPAFSAWKSLEEVNSMLPQAT